MSSVTHVGCRWYYLFWCLESQHQTCLCQEIDTTLVLARSMVGERTSLNRYLKCGQALKVTLRNDIVVFHIYFLSTTSRNNLLSSQI